MKKDKGSSQSKKQSSEKTAQQPQIITKAIQDT